MLIVLGVIFIAMIIAGGIMLHCSDYGDDAIALGGIFMIVIGAIATAVVVIASVIQINSLIKIRVVDEKIAMYEEQNSEIEEQIEAVVKQYQEYESEIMMQAGDNDSYITLVSLYPELKADTLVGKQIEIYLYNNNRMIELKAQKINERIYRWWLYFGG